LDPTQIGGNQKKDKERVPVHVGGKRDDIMVYRMAQPLLTMQIKRKLEKNEK